MALTAEQPTPGTAAQPAAPSPAKHPAVRLSDVHFSYPLHGVNLRGKNLTALTGVGGKLTKHRRRVSVQALEGIDLEIPVGARLGIQGHNGAGKSTLLRLIAGIYHPSSGSREVRGRIAAVFDKMLGMDQNLTGYENIRVRGMFLGLTPQELEHRLEDIVEFCELGEYLHLPLRVYSPGMRSRLGFSVSTAFDAEILLLDEWMGVGDRRFTERARERMNAFYTRAGTVVLVSHNDRLIAENCDRVIVMEKGRIVEAHAI